MRYIKPKSFLDDLFISLEDKSATRRRQCLSWMNSAMQGILNEPRDWQFLHRTVDLTITNNVITLPDTFQALEVVKVDESFCLTPADVLTRKEIWELSAVPYTYPFGYYLTDTTLVFVPGTTETTCTLEYQAGWPASDYPDSTVDTIFPVMFTNLLSRAVMSQVYEADREDFAVGSIQLDGAEMKKMKAWDNRITPLPKYSPNGYQRVS